MMGHQPSSLQSVPARGGVGFVARAEGSTLAESGAVAETTGAASPALDVLDEGVLHPAPRAHARRPATTRQLFAVMRTDTL